MKVRAIKQGFHVTLRQPGDEFEMEGKLPRWCEPASKASDKPADNKPQGKPSQKQADKPQGKPDEKPEEKNLPDA